jgi:hypothetical protein
MKHVLPAIGVVAVLALNWAALHDILHGEADVGAEWLVVVLSLAAGAWWGISRFRKRATHA